MSDPRRLLDGGGGAEDSLALLRSAKGDAPPPQAKRQLLDALGLGPGPGLSEPQRAASASKAEAAPRRR